MKQIFAVIYLYVSLITLVSCGGRGSENQVAQPLPPVGVTPKTPLDATVKIYFENTLSMDGYINGNTGFKDVFRELLVAVENEDQIDFETDFYLINDKITKTDFGVQTTKISEELTKKNAINANPNDDRGNSDFEKILDKILEDQKGNVVSVIMADFIYSPQKEKDPPSAFNKLKTYTKEAFEKALLEKKDLVTRIYHFSSEFNGKYYDFNNKEISGIDNRPYYYIVIAPENLMPVFAENIVPQLKANKGFKNEAVFTVENYSSLINTLVISSANNGRIETRGRSVEITDYPRIGNLEFAVLLNLEEIPIDNQYLLDINNYMVSNPKLSIRDIGIIQGKSIQFDKSSDLKMNAADLLKIKDKKFTHAFLFSADGIISEDLKFGLKKKVPSWVKNVNSDDDRKILSDLLEQSKTFSFGHMVSGVAKAYEMQSGNNDYFSVTIPIK